MKTSPQASMPRVALVGGLTAGPIMPLLAVYDEIKRRRPHAHCIIIDTKNSVSAIMAQRLRVRFYPIAAGKLRRYFSWSTLLSPLQVGVGFFQALRILRAQRITHVIGAGGFAQVPMVYAARLLGIPVHIHQQDIEPTLANTLCAPLSRTMSVTFEKSLTDFPQSAGLFSNRLKSRMVWSGNPVRSDVLQGSKVEAQKFFDLNHSWPTVFVLGGGGGASAINRLIIEALPELTRTVQVIHSTGKGKLQELPGNRYHPYEFIARTDLAYAAADIVISRAGVSSLTELANLGKVSIIIPMPDTHQESNARMLDDKGAAIVVDQRELTPAGLTRIIRKLLFDLELQTELSTNIQTIMPRNSASLIVDQIGL